MAAPLTAAQQLATVTRFAAAAGITVREYPGWRDRGMWRTQSKGHQPIAITIHQTAGGLGRRSVESYIRDILVSDPNVPDKCQAAVAPDGDIWLVAAGRANHALYYGPKALTAAQNASFPTSGSVNYRGSKQNWNHYTYGIECIGSGILPEVQRRSAIVWAAALAHAHGWTGQETHGHGEVSHDRGWADPGWDMGVFRRDVMALVANQNILSDITGGLISDPTDTRTELERLLDDMDKDELRKLVREEAETGANRALWTPPVPNHDGHWGASLKDSIARSAHNTTELRAQVQALTAAVEALAKVQGADPAVIRQVVRDAVADAMGGLDAEVSLTIKDD